MYKTTNNISSQFFSIFYLSCSFFSVPVQYDEYIFGRVDTDGLVLLHQGICSHSAADASMRVHVCMD